MESLEIQGFAGFKDLKIELNKINLFIGPQASGKSVLMKLAYFFRNIYSNFPWHFFNGISILDKEADKNFKKTFPISSWPKDSAFSISYQLNGYVIYIKREPNEQNIRLDTSKTTKDWIDNYISTFTNVSEILSRGENPVDFYGVYDEYHLEEDFRNDFIQKLKTASLATNKIVPSGRSFFAFLQENIFSFLRSENELDPSFVDFASEYERMKKTLARENREGRELLPLEQELEVLIQQVLKGKYVQEVDGDFLSLADGRHINLLQASSGQQEVLPLLQVIRHWFRRTKTAVSLYIEEPETHLFPQAQRQVLEALILMYNAHEEDMHLEISTHSPYLISVLNNMLLAGQLAQNEKVDQKALDQKHPSYLRVKKEELSAYMLKDGAAFSLWDEETGLLNAQILDEVGENIDRDFDELLNLEPYE
ncbi:AAA family ATPase [Saprospira grandis]|uniref:Endonuclease GajA/Old nuclease/RecF-like AAA domain-containing protein n=1 Tax=Saprospira grandis (strain Lewin) TaxID=984262 RepID=H6L636_SAPGL|nr:AAA family ATPase [Saprospira grandis]AFC26596.1 hypothetical protein SGRA_3880 [Saprospira grandis str. Lewin]